MSASENPPAGAEDSPASPARQRRALPAIDTMLLAADESERFRLYEILRAAGLRIRASGDFARALELFAEAHPALFVVATNGRFDLAAQDTVRTLRQFRTLRAGWCKDVKVIGIGEGVPTDSVDLSLPARPGEAALLRAVESLLRTPPDPLNAARCGFTH